MRLKFVELVGATPLHLLSQTALPLKGPTGAFIAPLRCLFSLSLFDQICKMSQPLQCGFCSMVGATIGSYRMANSSGQTTTT